MALCNLPLLVLWFVACLIEGAACTAEQVLAFGSNVTAKAQCSLAGTLADDGTTRGSLLLQTSSTLAKRALQESEPPTQHAFVRQDGTAQHHNAWVKAAPEAPQAAMPQDGTYRGAHGKVSKPRVVADIVGFLNSSWMTLLLPVVTSCIIVGTLCYEFSNEDHPPDFRRRTISHRLRNGPSSFGAIQALFLSFSCGVVVQATVVIPESYSLAADLGHDASWSGCLIGAAWPLGGLSVALAWYALTLPWSQASIKALVLADCAILAVSALVYSLAAAPPKIWMAGVSEGGRTWMLLASRAAMGLAWGTGSPCLRIIAQRVSPTDELLRLNVWYSFFDALGAGIGPFLSSLVCTALGLQSVGARSAAPLYFMAGFWAVMMICTFIWLPSNLEDLLSIKKEMDTAAMLPSPTGNATLHVECKEGEIPWRRRLWFLAFMFCFERILMLSSLEAATALVLETEFQWGRKAIGLVIGATLLIGVPVLAGIETTRRKTRISDASALLTLAVSCLAATLLLFPIFGRLLQQPEQGEPLLLVFADAVIFPTAFLVNGIADGLALQHRIPGVWLSPESMAVVRIAVVGVLGRPIGPWAARAVIASEGRGAYAGGQLVLAVLLLFGSLEMRRTLAELKRGDLDV